MKNLRDAYDALDAVESANPKMASLLKSLQADLEEQQAYHDKMVAEIDIVDPTVKKFFVDANTFIDLNTFETVKRFQSNKDGFEKAISDLEVAYYAALRVPDLMKLADPEVLQQRFYAAVAHAGKINAYTLMPNGSTVDAWATRLGV